MTKVETSRDEVVGEIGNTNQSPQQPKKAKKQPVQRLIWFFTFNNYCIEQIEIIESRFRQICSKYVFQEEEGSNGTRHLQGNIWLKKKMRYSEFKLPKEMHWEGTRNEDAALGYCMKDDTRVGEIYKWGFPKEIKIIDELKDWQREIELKFLEEPDDRTINWYWEDVGNVGKSVFTKYMVVKHKCCFCDGGKKADLVNLIFNTNMDECRAIIFDIPRANAGNVSYSTLEAIKNGLVCNTKYETGVKAFNPPHVFVFANAPPSDESKLSEDRWNIVNIKA